MTRYHILCLFFLLVATTSLPGSAQSDLADLQREIEKESAILKQNPDAKPSPKLIKLQQQSIQLQAKATQETKEVINNKSDTESKNLAQQVLEYKETFDEGSKHAIKVMDAIDEGLKGESDVLKKKLDKLTGHRDVSHFLSKVGSDSKEGKMARAIDAKMQKIRAERDGIAHKKTRIAEAKSTLNKVDKAMSALDIANNVSEGNYVDAAKSALEEVQDFLPDNKGKIKALDATTKLLGETSGGSKAINKALGNDMAKISAYSEKLKRSQTLRDGIGKSIKLLDQYKQAKELITKAAAYQKQYQELKDDGTTSKEGRRLIMGMETTGEALKKLASYLPPGASDFVEFYGDACKLPGTVNKVAKKWYKERDEAVNVSGPLAQTKAGREYDGILDRDPELNPDGNLGVYYDPDRNRHVLITDPDKPAIIISEKERDKLAQIMSDLSISGKKLTNSMIEELRKNGYQKVVIPGLLSNEEISIKDLAKQADQKREEARLKDLTVKATSNKNPSAKELKDYKKFDDLLNFSQKRYGYRLSEERKRRLFAKFQENPKDFEDYLKKYAKDHKDEIYKPKKTKEQLAKEEAEKFGVHPEDLLAYKNCMCKDTGGSLGGYYDPGDGLPCMTWGPLTGWHTPMNTSTARANACKNAIDWGHYQENQQKFDEMRKKDKATFEAWKKKERMKNAPSTAALVKIAKEENAKSVEKDLEKINELIFPQREGWEDLWIQAGEIYKRIAELMLESDKKAMQSVLAPRLINAGQSKVLRNSDFQSGIKAIDLSNLIGGPRTINNAKRLEDYKRWEKPWGYVLQKDIPDINSNIKEGKLNTAMKTMDAIRSKMAARLLPPSEDPRWVELSKVYNERSSQMQQMATKTFKEIDTLVNAKDPKRALELIDNFPKWEAHTEGVIGQRASVAQRVSEAASLDRQADAFSELSKLNDAISSYKKSLAIQTDSSVQHKLDALLGRKALGSEYRQKGDAALLNSNKAIAISDYTASIKHWPDPYLKAQIAKLKAQQKAQDSRSEADGFARDEFVSGASFADRFGSKESERNQGVSDRTAADSYNYPETTSSGFTQESMNQAISITMDTQKEHIAATTHKSAHSGGKSTHATKVSDAPNSAATAATAAVNTPKQDFNNGNIGGVQNNPTHPTTFTLSTTCKILSITNYHWNNAKGSTPGTIGVRDSSGKTYGPWRTTGAPGQGGVKNAYWIAKPNVTLSAGTYTVVDSETATWAHNSASQNKGMTDIKTECSGTAKVSTPAAATPSEPSAPTTPSKFSGTMNGTWSGSSASGIKASGTFKMVVSTNGTVKITFQGDSEGAIGGNISTAGSVQTKQAGGQFQGLSWSGTLQKDAKGNLSGSGTWVDSDDGYKGTWKSSSTTTIKSTTSASSKGRDGTYVGFYRDTRHEGCINRENVTLILKGNRVSGDATGTVDENDHLEGTIDGMNIGTLHVKFNDVIQGYIGGKPSGCFYYFELRKKK